MRARWLAVVVGVLLAGVTVPAQAANILSNPGFETALTGWDPSSSSDPAITLTRARHVYMVEADWLPEINRQAVARAHRIGQTNTVFARFIVADHPLDDALTATLARRSRIVRDFEQQHEEVRA